MWVGKRASFNKRQMGLCSGLIVLDCNCFSFYQHLSGQSVGPLVLGCHLKPFFFLSKSSGHTLDLGSLGGQRFFFLANPTYFRPQSHFCHTHTHTQKSYRSLLDVGTFLFLIAAEYRPVPTWIRIVSLQKQEYKSTVLGRVITQVTLLSPKKPAGEDFDAMLAIALVTPNRLQPFCEGQSSGQSLMIFHFFLLQAGSAMRGFLYFGHLGSKGN